MRYSENYGLYLPEGSDFVSPEQFNDNFTAIDGKLKAVEDKANSHKHGIADLTGVAAAGHKHSAADINPGIFNGDFIFKGSGDDDDGYGIGIKPAALGGTEDQRGTFLRSTGSKTMLSIISQVKNGEPDRYTRLVLNPTSAYDSVKIVNKQPEKEEQAYELYGAHNNTIIKGGYTGTGSDEEIHIPASPFFMVIECWGSGTLEAVALLFKSYGIGGKYVYGGVSILQCGSSPKLGGCYPTIKGTGNYWLTLPGSSDAAGFNVSGKKYTYWGITR